MAEEQTPEQVDEAEEFARESETKQPGFFADLWDFIIHNKKWWLTPIILVLLLFVLLVARGLGSEHFGIFSSAQSVAALGAIAADLGLNMLVTREIAARRSQAQETVGSIKANLQRCQELEIKKREQESRLAEVAKEAGIYTSQNHHLTTP